MTDELRDRLQAMNPEPVRDSDPEELATVFAVIEARRSTVTVDKAHDTATSVRPRGRWRRPVAVFAGMAIVILLAVGTPVLLFGGADAPTADTAATTTPPTTPETAPPTTAATQPATPTTIAEIAVPPLAPDPTAEDLVTVERVAADYLDTMVDGGRIWDVALGGPGLVAVGEIETPDDEDSVWGGPSRDALVLVSADGRSWERVDDLPETLVGDDWQQLDTVWGSSTGLIAQGLDSWYSSGDGITWILITDEDLYDAWERQFRYGETWFEFHEGGPGWVAALYRDVGEFSWDCVDYASRSCETPELQEVVVSSNGIDWEATTDSLDDLIEPPTEAPATPSDDEWDSGDSSYSWGLAWDNERVVAVRYHADAMVGVSPDGGETWLRVDPDHFADDGQLSYESFGGETGLWTIDVVQFGESFVIVGDAYHAAGVWILKWSEDGGA